MELLSLALEFVRCFNFFGSGSCGTVKSAALGGNLELGGHRPVRVAEWLIDFDFVVGGSSADHLWSGDDTDRSNCALNRGDQGDPKPDLTSLVSCPCVS